MNVRPQQYERFGAWLRSRAEARITVDFAEIEQIIGAPLPPSAREHKPWWSNSPTHPLARAWLMAGWEAPRQGLDLSGQTITLARCR
jgi:hypothetical protein